MKNKKDHTWNKGKITALLGGGAILLLIGIMVLIRFDMKRITAYEVKDGTKLHDENIDWSLDEFVLDDQLHLRFHAALQSSIHTKNVWILLYDQEEDAYYKLPTQSANVYKSDLKESEFTAIGDKHQLKKSLEAYEVCILYENGGENSLIHTEMGMNEEGGYYAKQ